MRSLLVLLVLISVFGQQAFAVDGYKDLKFGESSKTILGKIGTRGCPVPNFDGFFGKDPAMLFCPAFDFGGKETPTLLIFSKDKLVRVAFVLKNPDEAGIYLDAMTKRFGKPAYNKDEVTKFAAGETTQIDYTFASKTVILRQDQSNAVKKTMIIYTTSDAESKLAKSRAKAIEGGL